MHSGAEMRGEPPRVIIFSESGPLGGDLAACLSGRFAVERVTSLAGMGLALEEPAAALLVVPDGRSRLNDHSRDLLRQAVGAGCRVLVLGCARPDFEGDLADRITVLPQFPSPAELFEGLEGLGGAAREAQG